MPDGPGSHAQTLGRSWARAGLVPDYCYYHGSWSYTYQHYSRLGGGPRSPNLRLQKVALSRPKSPHFESGVRVPCWNQVGTQHLTLKRGAPPPQWRMAPIQSGVAIESTLEPVCGCSVCVCTLRSRSEVSEHERRCGGGPLSKSPLSSQLGGGQERPSRRDRAEIAPRSRRDRAEIRVSSAAGRSIRRPRRFDRTCRRPPAGST